MSDLTIILPARNEEGTISECISQIKDVLSSNNIEAKILVANNNSTDATASLASEAGAQVINVNKIGYGSTILSAIAEVKSKYAIMLDSDCSYNYLDIPKFYKNLQDGYDFVIGDRFAGGIQDGAMPFLHKHIGTPFISWLGRKRHKNTIPDYNCGFRGFDVSKIKSLNLKCEGMEFASEMIIKAAKAKLKTCVIPSKYYKDKRGHKGSLRTFRDGFRHLKVIMKNL